MVELAADYDPIQTIIQRVRKGPLMLLRRAYQSGCAIDIVTRHARGIKSIMRGHLHGFDKFMNLLLADVDEWMAHRARVTRVKPKAAACGGSSGIVDAAHCTGAAPAQVELDGDASQGAHDAREAVVEAALPSRNVVAQDGVNQTAAVEATARNADGNGAPACSFPRPAASERARTQAGEGDKSSSAQPEQTVCVPEVGGTSASGCEQERTQTRTGWQQVLRRRKLSRLLLRGDQVVLVSLATGPMRLPATLAHLKPPD